MKDIRFPGAAAMLLPLLLASACATAAPTPRAGVEPAAPPRTDPHAGHHAAHGDQQQHAERERRSYTLADVRFMQHMIAHHAQALVMSELVPERTATPVLRLLAERIEVSQRDEIAAMERWLRDRGEEVPPADAHVHAAMGHGEPMPGMLSQAELDALARVRGVAFDRMFLELMIRHHEGALVMTRELFGSPGAAQDPEIFVFAADVEADQTAEIQRMRRLLVSLPDAG